MFTLATSLIFCLVLISLVKTGFLGVVASLSSVLAAFTVVNIVGFLLPRLLNIVAFGKRARVPAVLYDLSRLRLVAASALVAPLLPAADDSDETASSDAHVQFVPGNFLGESSIVEVVWFLPAALCCCVVLAVDMFSETLPLITWVLDQVQEILMMWRFLSGSDYSTVLLSAYLALLNSMGTPEFSSSVRKNSETHSPETDGVPDTDIAITNDNQSLVEVAGLLLTAPIPCSTLMSASALSGSLLRTSVSLLSRQDMLALLASIAAYTNTKITPTRVLNASAPVFLPSLWFVAPPPEIISHLATSLPSNVAAVSSLNVAAAAFVASRSSLDDVTRIKYDALREEAEDLIAQSKHRWADTDFSDSELKGM
jgi:hypothetical protein